MENTVIQNPQKKSKDARVRKNVLKEVEQRVIQYLCSKIPSWVTPDILTFTGIIGSLIVMLGLVAALLFSKYYLLISILGFAVHWFGDSLDGRLAYYRNIPRKWYGWALDINADWISICIIGMGFYCYFPAYKFLAFLFVVSYGGSMILALLEYKINNQYIIDKAYLGPTELRILICIVLLVEIYVANALLVFAGVGSVVLLVLNLMHSRVVLIEGDKLDLNEKRGKRKVILKLTN